MWRYQLRSVDARIGVSMRHGYTYIRIPKAANSTISSTLDYHFPSGHEDRQGKSSYDKLSNLSQQQIDTVLNDHYIFTVVRNPYHRTLSAYLQKFARKSNADSWMRRFGGEIKAYGNGEASFLGFCRFLERGGLLANIHWMPQHRIIEPIGIERIDYVGYVESLEHDLRTIMDSIGGDSSQLQLQSSGPAPTGAATKCKNYYDDESADIVRRLFAEDFRLFGYSDSTF
ncbi:hypothetical protein HH1059_03370 [Halorhodospira halochloris]|uniref:Sulfotransferase family protein n=1 Tax=Halorhodospira halochloris TaxID=1052 RepID=A0A0X8X7F7_HALHR|nr:sulfotransferase family 2 domain-containing protein [Halorhodospira halochloris]MBK1652888.1 hypothetical protein [Halorhodospira halochloris]BAU57015.1 hypothetical protein HH1059_03370 [Halorhodospira halochloris]